MLSIHDVRLTLTFMRLDNWQCSSVLSYDWTARRQPRVLLLNAGASAHIKALSTDGSRLKYHPFVPSFCYRFHSCFAHLLL